MSVLSALYHNNFDYLTEKANVALEPLELSKMEQNIIIARMKKLAKDPAMSFANALDLVHRSYAQQDWERQSTIGDIARPGYTDKKAWKQYEEFIELSVALLAQYRGVNGDWRTNAFASVPTNDRSSMGSMMAAKVGESVTITWQSSSHLNMLAEQYSGASFYKVDTIFSNVDEAKDALLKECADRGLMLVYAGTIFEIVNPKDSTVIDTVTITTN